MPRSRALLFSIGIIFLAAATAAANTIDLTYKGSYGNATAAIGGQFWAVWMDQNSTGTGVIDPFLRIQQKEAEQGFNTSLETKWDTKPGTWTHAITLGGIPIIDIGGTPYREIILDINQDKGASNELLSLNQIQIFLSKGTPTGDRTDAALTTPAGNVPVIYFPDLSPGTVTNEVFRMAFADDPPMPDTRNSIELNFALNPGSGWGDMRLFVPNSNFTGYSDDWNFILYAQFGNPPGPNDSNDGFEEFAVWDKGTPPSIPEPTTLLLLGTGLAGIGLLARRKKIRARA
jgi:hypothetical protein